MMKRRLMAAAIFLTLLPNCVSTTDSSALFSTIRSEPMGHSQWMVSCVDSPKYCARESNKLCPDGFDVISNVTNEADYGRMTMIIKCHAELSVDQSGELGDIFDDLVGCSVVYALDHRSTALTTLTATELSLVAVSSCETYANLIRDIAHEQFLARIEADLTAEQQSLVTVETKLQAQTTSEEIRGNAIARAKTIVLRALAESK